MVLRPRLARRSNAVALAADGPGSGGGERRRSSSVSGEGVPLAGCSTGGMRSAGTGPTPHDLTSWDASSVSAISKKTNTPEFLLKLYRILQQEDPGIIQWDNGRIHVRNPHVLGQDVLHKYFRHSKYSSFQRQLNYFGFRKTQGKGKMSACTYTNAQLEGGTLKSLLGIKRKTSGTPKNGTSNSDTDEREEPDTSLSDDDSSMDGAHATSSLPPPFKRQRSVSSSAEASDYTVAGCCSMSDTMSTATSPLSSCCPSAAPSREASAEVPVGVAFFSPGSVPPAFSSTIPLNITRPFVVTSGAMSLPTQSFSMNCQRQGFEAPVIDPSVFSQPTTAPLPTPSPRNADEFALFYGFPAGFDLDCDMSWCEPPALGSLSSFDPESPRPQSASEQPSLETKPVVKSEAAPTAVWSTVPMIQLPQSQPAQQQMQPQQEQEEMQLAQQVPGVSSGEETPAGSVSVTAPTSALDPDFWSKLPIDPFCLPISPRYVAI